MAVWHVVIDVQSAVYRVDIVSKKHEVNTKGDAALIAYYSTLQIIGE